MENVTGTERREEKKKKLATIKPRLRVAKIATVETRALDVRRSFYTDAFGCVRTPPAMPSHLTASAPRAQVQWWPPPQPRLPPVTSDPHGKIHHLLGSPGASQPPPQGIQQAMGGESPG